MAKYQCVIALNGFPRYFKGEIYDFPKGKELRDKDGNLDKHFVLIKADPEPAPAPEAETATDEKPGKKPGRPPKE